MGCEQFMLHNNTCNTIQSTDTETVRKWKKIRKNSQNKTSKQDIKKICLIGKSENMFIVVQRCSGHCLVLRCHSPGFNSQSSVTAKKVHMVTNKQNKEFFI